MPKHLDAVLRSEPEWRFNNHDGNGICRHAAPHRPDRRLATTGTSSLKRSRADRIWRADALVVFGRRLTKRCASVLSGLLSLQPRDPPIALVSTPLSPTTLLAPVQELFGDHGYSLN